MTDKETIETILSRVGIKHSYHGATGAIEIYHENVFICFKPDGELDSIENDRPQAYED